jgi:hypothetical protein
MTRGDHIYVERGLYGHHGVDLGDGTAIDFAGGEGGKAAACIRRVTLMEFAQRAPIMVRAYGPRFSAEETVERAISMIGRSGYDLFSNNCEHFASWCVTGEHSSAQVENVRSAASVFAVATVVPRLSGSALVGLGDTAAGSAPSVMSGLARVGGSAVGGVTVLAGAGGLIGAGTMMLALRDKPSLPAYERTARRAARIGAVGGAAIGAGVVVYSVGALGVAGYSAAGLSTGLSGLGALHDGGMVAGLAVASTVPLLFAVAAALLLYCLARWVQPRADRGAHTAVA